MRIIITLSATKSQKYVTDYHKLQGFVYNLIKSTELYNIHDKQGYKFFCFSNIFPLSDMKEGDLRNFIVSSPNEKFIEVLRSSLQKLNNEAIKIGEMSFQLKSFSIIKTKIEGNNLRIITATPIILRIPERNYDRYSIPENERKKNYVFWRPKYSFEAFVKQLSENLIKKFNDFYGTRIESYDIFEQFFFKKSVATKIGVDGKMYDVIGSVWEFLWSHMDSVQHRIIEFGLEAGFGERNSMGFGFVNVVKV